MVGRVFAVALWTLTPFFAAGTAVCSGDAIAQKNDAAPPKTVGTIEMLTPTEGVDFNAYMRDVFVAIKKHWLANLPPSARRGEQGKNTVQFRIMQDGTVRK